MLASLLDRLSVITEEEKEYLSGKNQIEEKKYFGRGSYIILEQRLFSEETSGRKVKEIEIRPHTRFIDFPLHGHNYIEMMYVCSGSITHICEDKEIVLKKGGILLMNRYATHSIKKAGAQDIGVNFIISSSFFESVVGEIKETNVFTDFLIENLRNNGKPVMLQFDIDGILPIENLMENLVYSIINNQGTQIHILQKTMSLMLSCLVSFDNILVGRIQTDDYYEQLKNTIDHYIRTDYRNASLTVLANKLGLSHTYLCKWIAANMGMSFKELLVEQRFKVAEYLLRTTNLAIADIAAAVGYENASYFYRQFKKRFGKTPRAIRHE